MSQNAGQSSIGTIIITSIFSIILTLIIGAVIISKYGVETVAQEVSPFVDSTLNRVTEGLVPPAEKTEPETEADVIMNSVAQNQGSSVLIYASSTPTAEFLGRGILVSSNGFVITDAGLLDSASSTYSISVPGTKDRFVATVSKVENGLAVLKITISTSLVASFGETIPSPNELVAAIAGDAKMSIGTGIVTKVTSNTISTNIYGTMAPGSALVSKSGAVIGISTIANQKAGEANFRLLTKSDISIITNVTGS